MIKILYLTPGCFDKGGISRYCRYQISALRELFGKKSVRVFSLLGKDNKSFEIEFGVAWSSKSNTITDKSRFIIRTLLESLLWQPDIIHTAHINFSGLAVLLAFLCNANTILNIYGREVWSGPSYDAVYGLRKTDYVISDCHFTAHYIQEQGLRRKDHTKVIWDCMDINRFSPGMSSPSILKKYRIPDPNKHFILLTLGRINRSTAYKGYERLLKVFSNIAHKHPEARLVIAGRGDMLDCLKEKAKNFKLNDKVIFTGPVDEADLVEVYRSAHLFSLISDRGPGRGEGIPLTPLEAMATGVPILVGNQDGSQEAVQQGVNGYTLDPFDLDAHIKIISSLIMDEKLRRKLSEGSLSLAKTLFSYEGFREDHLSFYSQIMHTFKKAENEDKTV